MYICTYDSFKWTTYTDKKNTKVKREQATKIMLKHVQQKNMKQKKKKKKQRT
jgi:hypothetical protein